MGKRRDRSDEQLRRVRAVLRRDWDPIGQATMSALPEYEYDSYAGTIVSLLVGGADDARIAAHLCALEGESMGLPPRPPSELLPVVVKLRAAVDLDSRAAT